MFLTTAITLKGSMCYFRKMMPIVEYLKVFASYEECSGSFDFLHGFVLLVLPFHSSYVVLKTGHENVL